MVTKFDVFYALLIMRREHIEEKNSPEKLGITIKEVAKYFEIDYENALFHIKNLVEEEYIFHKDQGNYLPYVNRQIDKYIFTIYETSYELKINPNFLLNETMIKIIEKGLGRRNIVLSEFYPTLNPRTLKKYFTFLVQHNFVFIADKEKPATFHFNDDTLLRVVLKVFGKVPSIDLKKHKDNIDINNHITQIVKELKLFEKNKAIFTTKYFEIAKTWRLHFITHTTALEGNTMTFEEVKALLEEGSILKNHSIIEIDENRNIKRALEFLDEKLDLDFFKEEDLLELHYIILENIEKKEYETRGGWKEIAGNYREYPVYIKNNPNFKMSSFENVKSEMETFITEFNIKLRELDVLRKTNEKIIIKKIKFATWVHSELQHIHPFGDGNSRTTRMLFNYVMQRLGFPLIDIYASLEYMKHTKREDRRDDHKLYEFFVMLVLDNLKKMNQQIKK